MAGQSFIHRNEKKLLGGALGLIASALMAGFLIPKPEPIELPVIPPKPAVASDAGAAEIQVVAPAVKKIMQAYTGLEDSVMNNVGLPETDREAFAKAKEQIVFCLDGNSENPTGLDACIAENLAWLVHEGADALAP